MAVSLAFAAPSPFEILILLAVLGVPLALVILVVVMLFRSSRAASRAGFVVTSAIPADGPGRYRVVGVDKQTRADRVLTLEAQSSANAQVKAEMDGLVVTAVTKTI